MAVTKKFIPTGENAAQWLDFAIKEFETKGAEAEKCYELNGRRYYNYMNNEAWGIFIAKMKEDKYSNAYNAYRQGAGNELAEYNTRYGRCPPKMASYGSSSRMIYLLSRDIDDFCFEKQLPTTISGIANLDGYLHKNGTHYYVEAKCREPYSSKSHIVKNNYKDMYQRLNKDESLDFECKMNTYDENKMRVDFFTAGKEIKYFDIKQMISHLLAIATECLNSPTDEKIHFIYLLFDPNIIKENFKAPNHFNKICSIYKTVAEESKRIPFKALFGKLLSELHSRGVGNATGDQIARMADNFSFTLCDQTTYCGLLK